MLNDLNTFTSILMAAGPLAAVSYLNAGVTHRFTAVYRFSGQVLKNVLLFDKRREVIPPFLAVVPFERSFCQFVHRDQVFRTNDSASDRRLQHHPYRGLIMSYHSVPLLSAQDVLWGTLSHFDMSPMMLSDEEFELMKNSARLLAAELVGH